MDISFAKVVELLALQIGTKNQNGGAGVRKLSFSIIISAVGIDDAVELCILKSE